MSCRSINLFLNFLCLQKAFYFTIRFLQISLIHFKCLIFPWILEVIRSLLDILLPLWTHLSISLSLFLSLIFLDNSFKIIFGLFSHNFYIEFYLLFLYTLPSLEKYLLVSNTSNIIKIVVLPSVIQEWTCNIFFYPIPAKHLLVFQSLWFSSNFNICRSF